MHKLILAVAISSILAGCAGVPGYQRSLGSQFYDSSAPYYDDRYWPPVTPGQAFPPQIMDGGSLD
jgi:hypothetical protein